MADAGNTTHWVPTRDQAEAIVWLSYAQILSMQDSWGYEACLVIIEMRHDYIQAKNGALDAARAERLARLRAGR